MAKSASRFPHWKSVYNIWYQWRNNGTWQRIHDYWVRKIRKSVGKKQKPTACIIDSQSVKNDASILESTGYDAAKKVKGRKRGWATRAGAVKIMSIKQNQAKR